MKFDDNEHLRGEVKYLFIASFFYEKKTQTIQHNRTRSTVNQFCKTWRR